MSGLVDEDQAVRIKLLLLLLPGPTCRCHVGAILLGRVPAFFEADAAAIVEAPDCRDTGLDRVRVGS
jgi:hypothetical protein